MIERTLRLRAPGSKSETQRALLLTALAAGESLIEGPLDCDDSLRLRRALRACGVIIDEKEGAWRVRGGGLRAPGAPLDCGDGGTTLRFLAPLVLHLDGELTLEGGARLRERPLAELLQALQALGAEVRFLGAEGSLPVALRRSAPPGPRVSLDGSRSSQFASGLLLSAPLLPGGLQIDLTGQTVSRPYLDLTLRMMRERGASVEERAGSIRVAPGSYRTGPLRINGDWSAAGFLLAAAFISGRRLELLNLDPRSVQGDRVVVDLLKELRRPGAHRFDLTDCPDLLPPLAAAAVFAAGRVEIGGLSHARLKESDRPAVLAAGLSAAGVRVVERPDALVVEPGARLCPACLDPAGDHRMAMAFGLLSLREPGITVTDRGCVKKSYPSFWEDLERFR